MTLFSASTEWDNPATTPEEEERLPWRHPNRPPLPLEHGTSDRNVFIGHKCGMQREANEQRVNPDGARRETELRQM